MKTMSNQRSAARKPRRDRRRDPSADVATADDSEGPPPRETVLDLLSQRGVPMTADELTEALEVKPQLLLAFHNRLLAMERDGQLLRNRKGALCIVEKIDLVVGRVEGHADGHGFLVRDKKVQEGPDVFLSANAMRGVLDGDRVSARIIGTDRRGRPEGSIVEVLERANARVVGRVFEDRGVWFLVAENKRINQDLIIAPDGRKVGKTAAKAGQVVVGELIAQPTKHTQPVAKIVEILGDHTDPGMEIEIALRKHDLPYEFSTGAKRQAARLPSEVRAGDLKHREDVRDLPLVTIDGETAKDFDDAVWCEPLAGKHARGAYRLVVAIADVSHYVRDGDGIDHDARERSTSVYFPRRVIPMLPEPLSNNLCSLMPDVDRLCMVADMKIGSAGTIDSYRFYPAVMHSRARLTYTQVWDWLSNPQAPAHPQDALLLPHLRNLYALYQVLAKARAKRGAIDFETVETVLEFDENGKIESVHPMVRNDAHKLIEECMLAANVSTAAFLLAKRHSTLFRVHEGPTAEKLAALREFLHGMGLSLGGGDRPSAKDYAKLLARIRDRPDFVMLQTVLLRSLQQAVYSPDNKGHFGLAYPAYTHFTSPIRRYPDLLTHRALKAVLAGERYAPGSWDELGISTSRAERRADDASRDVLNWLKCYFMRDRTGETFDGTVVAVVPFGVFVTLDEVFVDGLLHISELGRDYFHHDAARHTITGERSGRVYRLADRVRVTVARVDLETSRIDFVLPELDRGAP